jgi:hypothetical protein
MCCFVILLCDFLYKCGMYIFFLPVLVFVVSSPPQLSFFPRSATGNKHERIEVVGKIIQENKIIHNTCNVNYYKPVMAKHPNAQVEKGNM